MHIAIEMGIIEVRSKMGVRVLTRRQLSSKHQLPRPQIITEQKNRKSKLLLQKKTMKMANSCKLCYYCVYLIAYRWDSSITN